MSGMKLDEIDNFVSSALGEIANINRIPKQNIKSPKTTSHPASQKACAIPKRSTALTISTLALGFISPPATRFLITS